MAADDQLSVRLRQRDLAAGAAQPSQHEDIITVQGLRLPHRLRLSGAIPVQAAGETENHGNADEESKREQRHIPFHLDGENEEEDDELLAPEEMKMEACIMNQSRSSPNEDQWDLGNELIAA